MNPKETKDLKNIEKYDDLDRQLNGYNGYYKNLPKKSNGVIDWENLDDDTLDSFDYVYKGFEKVSKIVNNFSDNYIDSLKNKASNNYGYGGSF